MNTHTGGAHSTATNRSIESNGNYVVGHWTAPGHPLPLQSLFPSHARQITPHEGRQTRRLSLWGGPKAALQIFADDQHRCTAYVWGTPAVPGVAVADIARWCAKTVLENDFGRFRELLGPFIVAIDEPAIPRLTLVSDVLGIRPLFVAEANGTYAMASDVWMLFDAGLARPSIDYGSVASWLSYGYNCTSGTLFSSVRRLPPGTAVVIDGDGWTEVEYGKFEIDEQPRVAEQVAEDLHRLVSQSAQALLSAHPRVTVPLSGGFDSRYLLALCAEAGVPIEATVNVAFAPEEETPARQVADALKLPLERVAVPGSVWDLYAETHHFMPDGFPVSKFVTHLIAQRHPGVPMVNGFLGDSLVRASNDRFGGRDERNLGVGLVDALQRKHLAISTNLIRPDLVRRIEERSRAPMEQAAVHAPKAFAWADLYFRQRHYISNNFLQHLDLAEVIAPFFAWSLLAYKLRSSSTNFDKDTYRLIFKRYFPRLADIPHSSDLKPAARKTVPSKHSTRWARELLVPLTKRNSLELLAKPICLGLVTLGVSRLPSRSRALAPIIEDALLTCWRAHLLEQRLKERSVDFDWDRI